MGISGFFAKSSDIHHYIPNVPIKVLKIMGT